MEDGVENAARSCSTAKGTIVLLTISLFITSPYRSARCPAGDAGRGIDDEFELREL